MVTSLTAYKIIYDALRKIGVVSLGDTVPNEVAEEALMLLNTIRAEWSINIKVNKRYDELFTVTAPRQFITLGTGVDNLGVPVPGDIAKRPAIINQVVICQGAPQSNLNIDLPIHTYGEYRSMSAQNITAIPNACFVDAQYPLSNIYFYPGINPGWTIRVIGIDYMTDYENIEDVLVDPPEYFNGLACNLALRLAQNYGATVGDGLVQQANSAMKHIKEHNFITNYAQRQGSLQGKSSVNFFSGR